jgi:hypothetical protein
VRTIDDHFTELFAAYEGLGGGRTTFDQGLYRHDRFADLSASQVPSFAATSVRR